MNSELRVETIRRQLLNEQGGNPLFNFRAAGRLNRWSSRLRLPTSVPVRLTTLLMSSLREKRGAFIPIIVASGVGTLVLMIGGLPGRFGFLLLVGVLLPVAALVVPSPRRLLEVGLLLSFGVNMDIHLAGQPHIVDPGGFPISLTGLLSVLLAGAWFYDRLGDRTREPLLGSLRLPFLGLWLTSLCSLLVSPAPQFSLYALVNLTYFTLMLLYLINMIRTPEELRLTVGWLMLAIGVTSLVALAEYSLDRSGMLSIFGLLGEEDVATLASTSEVRRVGGLIGGANGLATVLVQLLPLMLSLFLCTSSTFPRPLLLGGMGAGVLALIATYSRGGWIAFGITVLIVVGLMGMRRAGAEQRRQLRKFALLGTLLVVITIPLYANIHTRLTEDDLGSARSRMPMMKVAMRIIRDNPLFGVGLGNYENVMDRYDTGPDRIHQYFPWPVHNIFLNITAEIGLVGGFCFLLVCVLALWHGLGARNSGDPFVRATAIGLFAGLMGFLIVGMKELGPLGSAQYRYFWLLVALLVATRRISQNLEGRKEGPTGEKEPVLAERRPWRLPRT